MKTTNLSAKIASKRAEVADARAALLQRKSWIGSPLVRASERSLTQKSDELITLLGAEESRLRTAIAQARKETSDTEIEIGRLRAETKNSLTEIAIIRSQPPSSPDVQAIVTRETKKAEAIATVRNDKIKARDSLAARLLQSFGFYTEETPNS